MKKIFIQITSLLIFCMINTGVGIAQQITIPQTYGCLNDTAYVPVNYSNIDSLGALTLYISYDTALLTYAGFGNTNALTPGIMCGVPTSGPDTWQVVISWVGDPLNSAGVDLLSGKLCDIKFLYKGGVSNLNILPTSEFVDPDLTEIMVTYTDGSISPSIISQPVSGALCEDGQTSFYLITAPGSTYQWQIHNGAQWNNLQNDVTYSGVSTDTLRILQAHYTLNNKAYRCAVTNGCTKHSDTALLTVFPKPVIVVNNDTTICIGDPVLLNATGTTGIGPLQYYWDQGVGSGISHTVNPSVTTTYHLTVISDNTCSALDSVNVGVGQTPSPAGTITGVSSVCQGQNIVSYSVPAIAGATSYIWSYTGTGATISGSLNLVTINFSTTATSGNLTVRGANCYSAGNVSSNYAITVHLLPIAEAGANATYSGTPVQIGDLSTGPGTITWSPAAGLNSTTIAQPLASPTTITTYTLTVNNNGCIATDVVAVILGTGHTITGKTRYAGKANTGNPVPNLPTYNAVKYNINKVIVILKSYPDGVERARDTSNGLGVYQFDNVVNGNYKLSYDKYTADTMQWGDNIDAIDLVLLKYLIGMDTLVDPSKCFTAKYKKAVNVDNNAAINAIDISRVRAKIGSPYSIDKNLPKGNWVALDTIISVASNMNINLKTICYGDYNASSSKYRDSAATWSMAKSLPENIVVVSDDYITTSDPSYFEIPLRISSKMNDFSALGLELNYPDNDFKLISASMPKTNNKNGVLKINPTLEEIIADDNDLLVTDEDGTIRVVFATTDHFDVAAHDEIVRLGFRSLKNMNHGTIDFELAGTGVIGDKNGEENQEAYLLMPKIFVQGSNTDAGFEFEGYPNPFGSDATLTYSIPENGTVKLNVYNALGERVLEVINEVQISGKHSVVFSSKNLVAGIYTFKLDFVGADQSKCMVLKLIH